MRQIRQQRQFSRRRSTGGSSWRRWGPAVLVAVLVAACTAAAAWATSTPAGARKAAAPVNGGTLRGAMVANPDHLDPALANADESYEILEATNDGLLAFAHTGGPAGSKIIPDLAVAVPHPTNHGKTYTFQLRKGVRFGAPASRPITADDVKASIQRLFRMNSPGISYYTDIVGSVAYQKHKASNIKGIVVNDKTGTVTFHLSQPDGTFLYYMALTFADVLPKETPARDISTLAKWRVPTGPYMVSEYVPNDHITIVRNPDFKQWTKAVPNGHLDQIDIKIGVTADQAVNEVADGSLDWYMEAVAPGRLSEVKARYPKQVHLFPKTNITYFSLNTRKAPLNDVRVRKAINYAVDRRALVKIFGGQGVPAENIVPPQLGASYKRHTFYPHNMSKAKQLVAASGTKGQSIQVWASNTEPQPKAAQYLASVLDQLGYHATVKTLDESVYYDTMATEKSNPQIQYNDWTQDYPEASDFLDGLLNGSEITPVGNNDTPNLNVPSLNKMIDKAKRMPIGPARGHLWARIDAIASKKYAPLVIFMNRTKPKFVSARLQGLVYNPTYSELLPSMWLSK